MYPRLTVFLLVLFVVACSGGSYRLRRDIDGRHLVVKCKHSLDDCHDTADDVCGPGRWSLVSEDRHSGGLFADVLPGPVTWYDVEVACR